MSPPPRGENVGENRRVRWQPHERKWLKLLGTAALTFLISSFLCLFLVRTSRHDPLVVLCLFVLVPLTPPPAMLILGFYEQRLLRHVAGCVLSAVTGLAPFLYVLWEDADLGWEELTVVAGIYVPIMWFTGFIGSAIGIDVETGVFQALMDVHILNDGPVTFVLESRGDAGS